MAVVLTPAAPATSTSVAKIVNPLATSAVSTFEDSYHRRLAYTSGACGTSAVQLAHQARLVCCTRDTGLSVWRILHKQDASADCADPMAEEEAEASGGWEKVLDMELNAHTNLIASAISDNGQWLAVSDLYETRLFALDVDVSHSPISTHSTENTEPTYAEKWGHQTPTNTRFPDNCPSSVGPWELHGRLRVPFYARLTEARHGHCDVVVPTPYRPR